MDRQLSTAFVIDVWLLLLYADIAAGIDMFFTL